MFGKRDISVPPMNNEENILDAIFGELQLWKNKYPLKWCELCEVIMAVCPKCKNTTCNGGGCSECMKDYPDWQATKHCFESYLSDAELKTTDKIFFLKRYIRESLLAGFKEINWQWLHDNGHLCQKAYEIFDELKDFDPNGYLKSKP